MPAQLNLAILQHHGERRTSRHGLQKIKLLLKLLLMLKAELLEIAGRHRLDPVYETDVLAKAQGHRVLRLPVRHCELNPIERYPSTTQGLRCQK